MQRVINFVQLFEFLSTPSARRATHHNKGLQLSGEFLSTPSARRATGYRSGVKHGKLISIHALREEGDMTVEVDDPDIFEFLSTPSARRATSRIISLASCKEISIHALREEGDSALADVPPPPSDFYPRPPRGGRRLAVPLRPAFCNFYPRPPRGGRPSGARKNTSTYLFLSTPSARRATSGNLSRNSPRLDFYPRPPRGGRLGNTAALSVTTIFLSTPSARRATAKTETKSLFSYKLYNILHEFRRALIYNGSKNYPNHAKRLKNPVRRCRKDAEDSPFAPGRKTQNNSRPSCSKGG